MNVANMGKYTQCYQMLNLGKYQGVSVSALNKILKGKEARRTRQSICRSL